MRTDYIINRMAPLITPPLCKTQALNACLYKGFATNGQSLTIHLYEI